MRARPPFTASVAVVVGAAKNASNQAIRDRYLDAGVVTDKWRDDALHVA
jgi:hypothetical protein